MQAWNQVKSLTPISTIHGAPLHRPRLKRSAGFGENKTLSSPLASASPFCVERGWKKDRRRKDKKKEATFTHSQWARRQSLSLLLDSPLHFSYFLPGKTNLDSPDIIFHTINQRKKRRRKDEVYSPQTADCFLIPSRIWACHLVERNLYFLHNILSHPFVYASYSRTSHQSKSDASLLLSIYIPDPIVWVRELFIIFSKSFSKDDFSKQT